MRIGIVTATYTPSTNGVATSTALYVQGLRALGHEVRVFAPVHPRAVGDSPSGNAGGVVRLPSTLVGTSADYPLLLPVGPAGRARLPLAGLDVLHTMHPFLAGRMALAWSRRLGVPLVFTAHTQYHRYLHYARAPQQLGTYLVRQHVRQFAQQVSAVLVPGSAMEDTLREYGYAGPTISMPNPVDLSAFERASDAGVREQAGIPAGAPLLVFVGRLAPEKNLPVLLDAVRIAAARVPGLRLLMVGDGPSRAALQSRAAGLPVHFTGSVPYARVPDYLAAGDVFVTPSTSEILPMSMIEALAAGLPLVAARSLAAQDLIHPDVNGALCDPSAASLAEGIESALAPGMLERLRAGALRSAGAYDVRSRSEALLGVYRDVQVRRGERFARTASGV